MTRSARTALAGATFAALLGPFAVPAAFAQDADGATDPAPAPPTAEDRVDLDVVGSLADDGSFATLLAALEASGLADELKGAGPFTLFAPTDEAFEALPTGAVEALLQPANREDLVALLAYHVVPERLDSRALSAMVAGIGAEPSTIGTAGGKSLVVDDRVGLSIDGAAVTRPDIEATNGIVHAIDTVLLPDAS